MITHPFASIVFVGPSLIHVTRSSNREQQDPHTNNNNTHSNSLYLSAVDLCSSNIIIIIMWPWILTTSIVVAVVALLAQNPANDDDNDLSNKPRRPWKKKQQRSNVYVIGDLHGDAHCAKHWILKTGLVKEAKNAKQHENPSAFSWTWTGSHHDQLVFLGDYLDKGPTSRQTMELVQSLTQHFPQHVTALMGNHEMELLLDRDPRRHDVWGGAAYFQMAWSSVHPGEYLNYLSNNTNETNKDTIVSEEDKLLVDALYNASIEVYGYEQERNVVFQTTPSGNRGSIIDFLPLELRDLARQKLPLYQQHYLDAFRSGSPLGEWLEQRPVVALIDGTLFTHGGISTQAAPYIQTPELMKQLNHALAAHAADDPLYEFVQGTRTGRVVYDLLTHRGNHQAGACAYLQHLLPDGAQRLIVGHTPDDSVRVGCQGQFVAADSALGRWFRNSGNDYCPGHRKQQSLNGHYTCHAMNEACEGQIVLITNGQVQVIA